MSMFSTSRTVCLPIICSLFEGPIKNDRVTQGDGVRAERIATMTFRSGTRET